MMTGLIVSRFLSIIQLYFYIVPQEEKQVRVGLDIGSTTIKCAVLDEHDALIYSTYERHYSHILEKAQELLRRIDAEHLHGNKALLSISGSAGMGLADSCGVPFVQEVFSTRVAVKRFVPATDCVIELGGEDAKILFLTNGTEVRMNGSCAGGTGAFIDQMATLLKMSADEMNKAAEKAERTYTIASRCGVFAKSDIQPLLNEGARPEDVAASIFQAVVDQTVAGLTQGRELKGKIVFLGGPLHFLMGLRERFVETLKLDGDHAIFPEDGDCFAAMGAALCATDYEPILFEDALKKLEESVDTTTLVDTMPPLFRDVGEYGAFCARHNAKRPPQTDIKTYRGPAWLGIDAGSTTTKLVLIGEDDQILFHHYQSNKGNPADVIREQLTKLYELCGDRVHIVSSAVTGYGEALIQNAFGVDFGLVETVAHFRAARHFCPDVDFIIDIGGQDMKCFKIRNKCIDNISLNEACSSGCGSFIETFARSMGYSIEEFCKLGLFAKHPIDLGSRCTVFMNSSVKQAQKDGAGIDAISAGLSVSVVKNALYKVIRAHSPDDLGQHIVVQGGTFLNDAILRSFEQEIGRDVTRPAISGLMGAYGAALHAKDNRRDTTTLIGTDILAGFEHNVRSTRCGLCENHCNLTINDFGGGRRFISGNRCERPLGGTKKADLPNLYKWKLEKLKSYGEPSGIANPIAKIGLPFGLNNFELLPFWTAFLRKLGFETVLSDVSTRDIYMQGQHSIPSDTVCYPAKLMHGHIENLLEKGVDAIFYPCMTYNLDEERASNHYNCPVVAYYPELLKANVSALADFDFMMPYFELADKKRFTKHAVKYFCGKYPQIKKKQVIAAVEDAYMAQDEYYIDVRIEGQRAIRYADEHDLDVAVIAGRPYHVDPEINHGIDQLIASFGLVIVSEDAVWQLTDAPEVHVLNQWTYHSRMYGAAKYVTQKENAQLIQLVSFGCGIDAITTDEMRAICENGGKIYTQLKIDEISNLGAAKIRIRSMLAAVEEGRKLAEQQNA